jgi:ATP-binding cassette, subfamily G (WHITE), member 2
MCFERGASPCAPACRYAYIDFLRYGWGALMVNQFHDKDPYFNQNPTESNLTILGYYSLAGANKWVWLLFEFIFFIVFFVLSFLALQFKRHEKR